jgi:hypothetical protein
MAHSWRGAPIVGHHDCVFSGKGCHVALVGDLVNFHASGEGPRGHELVLDGVGMVQVSLFEELLKVVHGRLCLMLPAAHDLCSLLDVGPIVIGRGLLEVLLASLLAALLGILSGDAG